MSDLVTASNNYQQQVVMTLHGTVSGNIQNAGSNVVPKFGIPSMHPTVTEPAEGMLHITSITRKYKLGSSHQSNFFKKKPVQDMMNKLLATGIKREDIVCLVNPMSDAPRFGHFMVGGCYAHPTIAKMYEDYCAKKADWHRRSIEESVALATTEPIKDETVAPKPQIAPSKPATPAEPTTPPPVPNKPQISPNIGQNKSIQEAVLDLLSIYGGEGMAERLDDVIYTYTDSMIGRGDSCTMENICALRMLRDAFRADGTMRIIAV